MSERWGREKRFYVGRRSERRRTAFWRAAQNTLGASGAEPTRACVTRTVNGTGQCWKTYLGRPETDELQGSAMCLLGNDLSAAKNYEDAMIVREAELFIHRRVGTSEHNMYAVQNNLANSYQALGRLDQALSVRRDVYTGRVKLRGEEHKATLMAISNYADSLVYLQRFEEAKGLLRKTMVVARRVLGESYELTFKLRCLYGQALYWNDDATLDDLREAVTTLEDTTRIARRVLGGPHPTAVGIGRDLEEARAALRARETPPPSPPFDAAASQEKLAQGAFRTARLKLAQERLELAQTLSDASAGS